MIGITGVEIGEEDPTVGDSEVAVEASVIAEVAEEEASEIDVAVLTDYCIQNCPCKFCVDF